MKKLLLITSILMLVLALASVSVAGLDDMLYKTDLPELPASYNALLGSSSSSSSSGRPHWAIKDVEIKTIEFLFDNSGIAVGKALPTTVIIRTEGQSGQEYAISNDPDSVTVKEGLEMEWEPAGETVKEGKDYKFICRLRVPSNVRMASDFKTIVGGVEVEHPLTGSRRDNYYLITRTFNLGKAGDTITTRPSTSTNTRPSTNGSEGSRPSSSTDKVVTSIIFEDYVYPEAGQELNPQDVKLKEGFPGKIESANYTMFQKTIAGTASLGDNMALYIRVELNEGYTFSSEVNATLNGKTQDMRIHNDSMGDRLYGFAYNYVIPESSTIKIEDQSPETIEFVEGEDVKLFVKATGAESYQWSKYTTTGGGVKQKYSPSTIDGATKSEYVIEKATKELDAGQYRCTLTAKDKSLAYTKTITLKLVEAKSGDSKTEETKPEEKVEKVIWTSASPWAIEELNKANDAGLIPTIFNKEDLTTKVTRKEFAHIAVKLYEKLTGKKAIAAEKNPFTDTKDEEVLKAYNVGITQGTSETTFGPDKEITREQMATMMQRALAEAGVKTDVDLTKVKEFSDDKEMHNWSRSPIYFMAESEIIKGVDQKEYRYGVTGTATREQSLLVSIRSAEKFAK